MKDIVVVMSDQHGQAYMQTEDERIETPNLVRIGQKGRSYSNCFCNAPLCVPSRMSFLSGKLPGELQIFNNDTTLPQDMPTIAHALGIQGYHTVLAGRMHFKGDDQNHGFDERLVGDITSQYWGTGGSARTDFGDYAGTTNRKHCLEAVGGGYSPVMAYDEAVFQAAMECLMQEHEQPLFLLVGFYGPHFPFTCEPSLYEKYKERFAAEELTELESEPEYRDYRQQFTPEKARNCKAAYCGQVETLDRYIGTLYDLCCEKRRERVFFYLSDHGEQLGTHGIFGKQTLYQESIRVPLIIEGPGIRPGICGEQVSLLDVSRTILEQADIEAAWHHGQGINLTTEEPGRKPVVVQQILEYGKELLLAEAVIRLPYKAERIDGRTTIYQIEKHGKEKLCTSGEGLLFLEQVEDCFSDAAAIAQYLEHERAQRKQHEILKEWGTIKKPKERASMMIPQRAGTGPIE